MMGAPIGPESIAVFVEPCFTDWLQHLLDTLLNHAVFHGGDTQRAHTSILFWDFNTAYCVRMKILQPRPHVGNQFLRSFLAHFNNRGRVYTFGLTALVLLDGTIGQQDILLAGNQLHQVCKDFAVLTFLVQIVKYFLGVIILVISE